MTSWNLAAIRQCSLVAILAVVAVLGAWRYATLGDMRLGELIPVLFNDQMVKCWFRDDAYQIQLKPGEEMELALLVGVTVFNFEGDFGGSEKQLFLLAVADEHGVKVIPNPRRVSRGNEITEEPCTCVNWTSEQLDTDSVCIRMVGEMYRNRTCVDSIESNLVIHFQDQPVLVRSSDGGN